MDEHNPAAKQEQNAQKLPRSRWMLHMQAVFWRTLMGLGKLFHELAPPRPPKPNFTRAIQSTIAGVPGQIILHFYVPKDYEKQKRQWKDERTPFQYAPDDIPEEDEDDLERGLTGVGRRASRRVSATFSEVGKVIRRRSQQGREWGGYPVVINFHGGGFTLGTATDDARWCGTVVDEVNAVVVSVDYRLAPESPFPTAVEDGVDAVMWIHEHAADLGIDREKIAISGFSSGGNMAFTVPLRLYDEQTGFSRDDAEPTGSLAAEQHSPPEQRNEHVSAPSTADSASSSSTKVAPGTSEIETLDGILNPKVRPTRPGVPRQPTKNNVRVKSIAATDIPNVRIRCIVPWYPSLDYTRTREQRRATCLRKDQELPALFTDLFDESYLHPPRNIELDSPYLSPGVAPTDPLKYGLPEEIIMHTCEWDMLLDEGVAFRDRLLAGPLHKKVWYRMVEGVPHGWDKAPNPWKPTPGVKEHYLRACKELRRVFGPQFGVTLKEHATPHGASAAPRGSVSVVR